MNDTFLIRRISHVMTAVNPELVAKGRTWYHNAHQIASDLAGKYGYPIESMIGMIAVLSPGVKWEQNLKDVESIIQHREEASVVSYSTNKMKALAIAEGDDPFQVIRGRKVTAFFYNILNPNNPNYVTLDRWMLRVFGIIDRNAQNRVFMAASRYNAIADAIKAQALKYWMLPCQLQAVIWLHVRGL